MEVVVTGAGLLLFVFFLLLSLLSFAFCLKMSASYSHLLIVTESLFHDLFIHFFPCLQLSFIVVVIVNVNISVTSCPF